MATGTTRTVKKSATKKPSSSIIQDIQYQDQGGILTITFTTGKTYRYHKVEKARARALVSAESQGQAFHRLIRGKYLTEQVNEESVA